MHYRLQPDSSYHCRTVRIPFHNLSNLSTDARKQRGLWGWLPVHSYHIQRKRLCAFAVVQIMQERMLHFFAGSCFPVLNLIQVLPADVQFLCQSALGITAGVPFCFQCFDKFHVIHVHSSNQKRHTPIGAYTLYFLLPICCFRPVG